MINNKKGVAPLVFAFALLTFALVFSMVVKSGVVNLASITGGTEYIQAPYYATISCEQSGTSKSISGQISPSGQWISDAMPKNTNEWSIKLQSEKTSFLEFTKRFEYYVCPQRQILNNCKPYAYKTQWSSTGFDYNLGTISSDQFVWVQYQKNFFGSSKESSGGTFGVTYKPFELRRQDSFRGGNTLVSNALGCQVPATDIGWLNRVIDTNINGVVEAGARDLRVGEKFNYISGTVTRLAEGNLQDGGYCIYSNGKAQIYPLSYLRTASGTYNVVDLTKSPLRTAICCNGDNLPDKTCVNGKWASTQNTECSLLNACEGTEWRGDLMDDNKAIKYSCVKGQCIAKYKDVECTTDAQCPTNQKCSTIDFICIDAGAGGAGTERIPIDPEECEQKGYNWIPQKTTTSGGLLGFGGKTVVIEAHCEKPSSDWVIILLIIVGMGILAIFWRQLYAGARAILRRVGL